MERGIKKQKLTRKIINPNPINIEQPHIKESIQRYDHAGQPTLYKEEYCRQVYLFCLLGASLKMIAANFNVPESTIENWGRQNPKFLDAIKRARLDYDSLVAEQAGIRALGYDYVETEHYQQIDIKGKVHDLTRTYHRHMPGDVKAQQFWLRNRQRAIWSDTTRTELYSKVDIDIQKKLDLSLLSKEEQDMIKSIAIKQLAVTQGSLDAREE
jgi:hypothetical protein